MKNPTITQLTKGGLFFILGKLYYTEALLEARFDGDTAEMSVGVEEALSELEYMKEPLLRLVCGPPDMRAAFTHYLKCTYELEIEILAGDEPLPEDGLLVTQSRLSVVKSRPNEDPEKT